MSDLLEYKGYHGTVEYSAEDRILFGSVFGVNDSLNYHGSSLDELERSFHSCIDNYLSICEQIGKQPEKEFKGSFNVRIAPDLHRDAALAAMQCGCSLNQWIASAVQEKLSPTQPVVYFSTDPHTLRYSSGLFRLDSQYRPNLLKVTHERNVI